MRLARRNIALVGRFSRGVREQISLAAKAAGARVQRDLMRGGDVLVVGGASIAMIDSGALDQRLAEARRRRLPVFGELTFAAVLRGEAAPAAYPLSNALASSRLSRERADLLAAFDLIHIEKSHCRFGDVAVMKAAEELIAAGCLPSRAIRILLEARVLAPLGRHKVVLGQDGLPQLLWEDGITTLDGQRYLPINLAHDDVEDLFEAGAAAETDGRLEEAARLFDACARSDSSCAVSLYNFGNIRLRQERFAEAVIAYRRALARDPDLVEAYYNLAAALEAQGQTLGAEQELAHALERDPAYPDALFNLAQLKLGADKIAEAAELFERYLKGRPPAEWALKARRGLAVCRAGHANSAAGGQG